MSSKSAPTVEHGDSLTIDEFCSAEKISDTTYFKMRKRGLGPREVRFMGTVRISPEARRAWHAKLENPTGAMAKMIETRRAEASERSVAASQKSVASPLHVSNRRRPARGRRAA